MLRCLGFALAVTVAFPSPCLSQDIEAMLSAIVRVNMRAIEGARSNSNLGPEREGTGVVIDERGHILTIGYIVLEAASIEVSTHSNRTVPAVLAAYDHASGFALLRAAAPIEAITPMPLGSADALALHEPVMVLPHGGRERASIAMSFPSGSSRRAGNTCSRAPSSRRRPACNGRERRW